MKKLSLILFLILTAFGAYAQNVVKGTVKDAATDEPLVGVGVIVSTGGGTITDLDGNYSVSVGPDATITFNILGYKDVVEKVNNRGRIDVFMNEDVSLLDEVVVLGYTSQKKNELSCSVVSLKSEELLDNSTSDLGTMIQGKAAGVVVMNASGQPGEGAQIRIRGTGSISASADPLYVVDGIAGGSFNPNDVESVTILKDASATALYGASAAGGVIVITTKSAKDRTRTDVNFKASAGIKQALSGRYHNMGSRELYKLQKSMMQPAVFSSMRPKSLLDEDFDWYNAIFKKAVVQDYYISVAGISGRVNYFASIDHYDEQGSLIGTAFNRNSARVNLSAPIGEKVMFNLRLAYNRAKSNYSTSWLDTSMAYQGLPWDNPFDKDGNPKAVGTSAFDGIWYGKEQYNPFHSLLYNKSYGTSEDIVADLQINWNITDWLTFSSTSRFGSSNWTNKSYYDSRTNTSAKGTGSIWQGAGIGSSVGLTELLKAHKTFGDHSLNGIIGYEVGWGSGGDLGAGGGFMPTGMEVLNSVGSEGMSVSGSDWQSAAWAVLAQAQYSYAEKYIATASIRYDKTYKFAPKNRAGFFPGVSAAWIINKESFMEDLTMFDLLKLRLGYGKTGNSDISPFLYMDTFSTGSNYNNKVVAVAERMANDELGWEVAYMASLGIEARMFDRVNLSLDLYNTNNKDLLLEVPQAPSSGFTTFMANVGTINNKGIEIAADADIIKSGDWKWNVGINFGLNRNTVVYLPNGAFRRGYGTPKVEQIVAEGHDIYTWYMPEWAGVNPENGDPQWWTYEKEVDGEGNPLYYVVDKRGNPTDQKSTDATLYPVYTGNRSKTNKYTDADYRMAGTATPKFTGGLTSDLRWGNWSLGAQLFVVYGNKVFNRSRVTADADGGYIDYNMMSLDNGLGWVRWDPKDESTHTIATHPRPMLNGNQKSNSYSTRYLEDGSFLRLKNVTLAYNIGKPLFNGFIQGGRIYFTADNVFTLTKFSGADPEVQLEGSGSSLAGVFGDNYPVPRAFIFGIDLKF